MQATYNLLESSKMYIQSMYVYNLRNLPNTIAANVFQRKYYFFFRLKTVKKIIEV